MHGASALQVDNVARYLNGLTAFTGRVVFVTTPSGIKGCAGVNVPNEVPSDAARYANATEPQNTISPILSARAACHVPSVPSFLRRLRCSNPPSETQAHAHYSMHTLTAAGCERVRGAHRREEAYTKRAFWYSSNPQGSVLHPDATGSFHTFRSLQQAEHDWVAAFQKHA
jgi:hypothetical protein